MEKEVLRTGPFAEYIADAVRVGDSIYLSGQVGVDKEGKPAATLAEQVKLAYQGVSDCLEHFGASMDNVVDEMWLVTDMEAAMGNMDELWAIREAAYGRDPEVAQTLVQVAGLVFPELMIEIKCTARI